MSTTSVEPLILTIRRARSSVVVCPAGALAGEGADVLRRAMRDLVDDQGNLDVVLDCRALSAVDHAGLGVLAGAHRALRDKGGSLRVAALPAAVRRALEHAGLAAVLHLTDEVPLPAT